MTEFLSTVNYKMFCIFFFIISMLCKNVSSISSSNSNEGHLEGYLGDCPGSLQTAIITKKGLDYLSIVVQGPGEDLNARKARYSYFQANRLAEDPDLDFERPTVLYVGGYGDSPGSFLALSLGAAYKKLNYNVLLLDSSWFTTTDYPVAVRVIRPFAKHVAEMLVTMMEKGLDPKSLELVGISLGAHTMGFIAKHFRELSGKNISTLIGLDPAGACFWNAGPEDRLATSDGDFVNSVHTDINNIGMETPTGHVNFYVNGGDFQPREIYRELCGIFCSHIRSFTLWRISLEHPKSFIGIQCDSIEQARNRECYDRVPQETNILSQYTDKTKPGIYYLSTSNTYPFYLGHEGLLKENDFFLNKERDLNKESELKI